MAVMIGIDPHKGSHTAVALDEREESLGELRVRSATNQVEQLITWATPLGERTWAIEGAGGLGYLLAQQLVAAGERVVDVQPKLAARVRLLATGASNKNDPNDARSVAVAALRSATVPEVRVEDHAAVMKVWAKRHRDLSRQHNRVACRLHSVLCDLVPGGIAGEISPAQATSLLDELEPAGAVAAARHELAVELVADLVRLADQRREARRRIAAAVTASKTTVTELFGVGPIVAATMIGEVSDISRFPTRDHFAAYNGTAPIEASSGGTTQGVPALAPREPPAQPRHPHGRRHPDPLPAHRRSRLLRPQDRPRPHRQGSDPGAQAADQRRHLHPAPPRRSNDRTRRGGPGRALEERLCRLRGRLTPRTPALRPSHSRTRTQPTTRPQQSYRLDVQATAATPTKRPLDTKRTRSGRCGRDQSIRRHRSRTGIRR